MMRILIVSLISALLIACISPTPYKISSSTSKDGLVVQKITETEYYISFYGNEDTSQERANDFALLGAAQQAVTDGYRFFSVLRKDSITTSKKYAHTNDYPTALKVVKKDGSVYYTNQYNAKFGTAHSKFAITRPRVSTRVKFFNDDESQNEKTFKAQQVIIAMSKKYDLKL